MIVKAGFECAACSKRCNARGLRGEEMDVDLLVQDLFVAASVLDVVSHLSGFFRSLLIR